MTNTDNMDALLVAYADGELDDATAAEVEAYLAATPAAQRALSVYRETASLLRSAFPEGMYAHATPPNLAPPRRRTGVPGYGWAVAASILVGIAGYGAGAAWPGLIDSERGRMLTEVAEYHSVYSRETVHLVEVPAAQADHLKAWLGNRINRPLVIPDFKGAGLTFAGGRMVVVNAMPGAELMYTREHGLPIAFCILSHEGAPSVVEVDRRGSLDLATWDDGSHAYVIVGEASPDMVRELARLARRQI